MTQDNALTRSLFFIPSALVVIIGMFGGWLIDHDRALQAVRNAGYHDPTITDWHAFSPVLYGCSREDSAMYAVQATTTDHAAESLTVCCGLLFRACTVLP